MKIQATTISRPVRPNPADTISTGQSLGSDDTQKDLFALSAGIAGTDLAPALAKLTSGRETALSNRLRKRTESARMYD